MAISDNKDAIIQIDPYESSPFILQETSSQNSSNKVQELPKSSNFKMPASSPYLKFCTKNIINTKISSVQTTRIGQILNPASKTAVLIISGNPGCTDMYGPMANQIFHQFHYNIFTIGNYGHSADCIEKYQSFEQTIINQVQHKIDFIDQFLLSDPNEFDNIILIGHSIGAYCITELLYHYFSNKKISGKTFVKFKKGLLMTPTIELIGNSKQGQDMLNPNSWFNYQLKIQYLLVKILGFIPFLTTIICWLVTAISFKTVNFSKTGNNFASYQYQGLLQTSHHLVIKNCSEMGLDEMKTMPGLKIDQINQMTKANPRLFYAFYSKVDGWVNSYAKEQMEKNCKEVETKMEKNMIHGWCCDEVYNSKITEECIEKIAELRLE